MSRTENFMAAAIIVAVVVLTTIPLAAQEDAAAGESGQAADLAKKLQNPIASLISVPFQFNYDEAFGPDKAASLTLNIQPVIPISVAEDWNLITRTIVPVIYQEAPIGLLDDDAGMGDILQSFFLSPKEPVGGWIIGAGPAFLWPTATDGDLGAGKWGAGPTAVVLKQDKGFTYGILANYIWSYAGWGDDEVNATFLQPFISYTTKSFTTFTVNTESSYDWNDHQWTVPVNFQIQQLLKIGDQPVALSAGYRYYAEAPDNGPEWGVRLAITLLFPQ